MICYDAFKNLFVKSHPNGASVSPCCVSNTKKTQKIDFVSNQYLQHVRQQFNDNQWPSSCEYCKRAEESQCNSRRIGSNRWYQDNGLDNNDVEFVRLDYWAGDLCNLACAICGPHFSSVWKQHLQLPIAQRKTVINEFWKDLDLSKLQYVHFNGGEPLLSKEHVSFLKALPNKHNITISYNTNGTVKASPELNELWLQFKLVELVFSIDDVGPRFEYQRWPALWDQVVENLKWYIDCGNHNSIYSINTTVSWLNRYNLAQLDHWLEENFAQTKFSDIIERRRQPASGRFALENDLDSVRKNLDQVDSVRGTAWKSIFPELLVN